MRQLDTIDAAEIINRRAEIDGWPLQCDGTLQFQRPELRQLAEIWHRIAGMKGLPPRADFDARTLKPFLRNIAINERADHGTRYRTRLVGTALAQVGGDTTGHFLDEMLPTSSVGLMTFVFDTVLAMQTPLRQIAQFRIPKLDYLTSESFIAPLSDSHGTPALILICIYFRPR